jgi:hypothetical protein
MNHVSPNRNKGNDMKKKPLFREDEGRDQPPVSPRDNHRQPPMNRRGGGGNSYDEDDHRERDRNRGPPPGQNQFRKPNERRRDDDDRSETDSVNEYNMRHGGGGGGPAGRGNVPPMKKKHINFDREPSQYSDDESISNHHNNGGNRGGGGRGGRPAEVSPEEYDELSKLCDKLLTQQEQLQSEIRQQAHLIKVSCCLSFGCLVFIFFVSIFLAYHVYFLIRSCKRKAALRISILKGPL